MGMRTMTATRGIVRYDVARELGERWPGWRVRLSELDGVSEIVNVDDQTIVIDMRHWPEGLDFACCHALIHLDWSHTEGGGDSFTVEQEDLADWVARVRLDIRE